MLITVGTYNNRKTNMLQFLASIPSYGSDIAAQNIWSKFNDILNYLDGICYYKHPVIASVTKSVPDLTLLIELYQPLAVKILNYTLDEIDDITQDAWTLYGEETTSPLLDLDDYSLGIKHKFDKDRSLRNVFQPVSAIAFPQIARSDYEAKFGKFPANVKAIWSDLEVREALILLEGQLDERSWRLAKSIFQGINPLNNQARTDRTTSFVMGEAIRILEKDIALLDEEQHKVAIQIAPGPQRVRGLAGTGKTVILAMKAANIHLRYPDKNVLFTFHTQSLYNQAKSLITKFYRVHSDEDPDWNKVHIRHGWGAIDRPGVYSELCRRHGIKAENLNTARKLRPESPLGWCCSDIMTKVNVQPFYDYILVDEGQDFPPEFFRLLYKLCGKDKQICWAYDELQSLSSIEVPNPTELFGVDDTNTPLVTLDGENYPGGIEKDFVLHRSYRCPRSILMLAHGVGLGIHAPRGCVQMLSNRSSWETIGYEIEQGNLSEGETTLITRPMVNSPNRIRDIYQGNREIVELASFPNRNDELLWVAESIKNDIEQEQVSPEQIVAICLDKRNARQYLAVVQNRLTELGISSTIPGLVDSASDFAEQGMVTLSTVHRAKGNEAPVIYVLAVDYISQYVEEIETRNRTFTAISRSKGWIRLSGSEASMKVVSKEVNNILKELPHFRFIFPDMKQIRKLDASETSRRRNEVKKASDSVSKLLDIDVAALSVIGEEDLEKLLQKIREAKDANQ